MCADGDCSVAIQRTLPDEPKLSRRFTSSSTTNCDREALGNGIIHCGDYNINQEIEIGAEVFAAEFIYPEAEFREDLSPLPISVWDPEAVVRFKRACKAKVSYKFLCKRLERLGLIVPGQFDMVQFQKLEEQLFGVPFYRRNRRAS
jgi:hypothetical protein